jgi:hypothetical protein
VSLIALALTAGLPLPQGKAVKNGHPAEWAAAQVRIFENGDFKGSGTLVDRNWVLTVEHLFDRPDSTAYTLRFGTVNDQDDASGTSNLRTLDRIEVPPGAPDLALVHFADPVPADTWIPSLATQPPTRGDWGLFYGWGPDGHVLNRALGVIIDPVATANAAALREDPTSSVFAEDFPPGTDPMAIGVRSGRGDSGSGVFTFGGFLSGTHVARSGYRYVNGSGNLYGEEFWAGLEQPVWRYRQWIMDTISGAGSSNPPHDELKRRRLTEGEGGSLPLTMPPQVDICDPGRPSCSTPDPVWQSAILVGYSQNQGTVLARCVQGDGNACTFDGVGYAGGSTARLPLGAVGVTGTRRVMVWCRSSTALNVGDPPQPVLEVSFSNDDDPQGPVGMGWWYVAARHVTTDTTTPVDTTVFTTC